MPDARERRMNVLIVLCSAILGIFLTSAFVGLPALPYSLFPTILIAMAAFLYIGKGD